MFRVDYGYESISFYSFYWGAVYQNHILLHKFFLPSESLNGRGILTVLR